MDAQYVRHPTRSSGVASHEGVYDATVLNLEQLAPHTFWCQAETSTPIPYQSGQYCMVAIADTARAFSFASPPRSSTVNFLIDTRPQGPASRFWQQATPRTPLSLTGPYGHFILDTTNQPLLFVAGGTGLAPLYAHIMTLLSAKTERPLTLIIGHHSEQDVFWHNKLAALASQSRFDYRCVIGSLTPTLSHLPDMSQYQIYICGSAGLCTSSAETLYAHGASPARVHYELFT